MTEQEKHQYERADTLHAPKGNAESNGIHTRSPVTRDQEKPATPKSKSKLVRNMLGTFIIGGSIAGTGAYHYLTGWNPFNTTKKSNNIGVSVSSGPEEEIDSQTEEIEEVNTGKELEKIIQKYNLQITKEAFRDCPDSPHLKAMFFDTHAETPHWSCITKRITFIPFQGETCENDKDIVLAVLVMNSYLSRNNIDYDGNPPHPVAVYNPPEDSDIQYIYYNRENATGALVQVALKQWKGPGQKNKGLGFRSFNIEKCPQKEDDSTGIIERPPVE